MKKRIVKDSPAPSIVEVSKTEQVERRSKVPISLQMQGSNGQCHLIKVLLPTNEGVYWEVSFQYMYN